MKINISSIKEKLVNNESSLVDPRILSEDMYPMWEYVQQTQDMSKSVELYCKEHNDFDLKLFSKAYLSDILGFEVDITTTEDNYIKISNIKL